jgi:hypothetical protein
MTRVGVRARGWAEPQPSPRAEDRLHFWAESDFKAQEALKIVDTCPLPLFNETGVFHESAKSCLGVQ